MHVRVRWGALCLLTAIGLVAVACAGGTSDRGTSGAGGEQAAAAPAPVEVMLSEFKIDPSTIQVPTGQPIAFSVMNMGTAAHTFAVDVNAKVYDTGEIQPGSTSTLKVPALAAGTYQAYCSVAGHRTLGMTATVSASDAGITGGAGGTDTNAAAMSTMTPQQMADMHKAGVEAFLAGNQTSIQGGRPLKPKMDGSVKVFLLTVSQIKWEVSKGVFKDAMAFDGQVPGPEIHVSYGDRVRFVVQNQMAQPTVVHFHGMTVPNAMDGVPYVTQDPIMPGQYWTYEFTVKDPPGIYVYHSHFNSTEQVSMGLYGSILVLPDHPTWNEDYTEILNDGPLGYTINGKSFPATAPLTAKLGDVVHIRLANLGQMIHPFHMHGYHFSVLEQDGQPLAEPSVVDTLMIAPGQTFDVEVHAVYPGVWAFHCHILSHVEGPQGMFGMVTALIVK